VGARKTSREKGKENRGRKQDTETKLRKARMEEDESF
jgi:hypothetical protein